MPALQLVRSKVILNAYGVCPFVLGDQRERERKKRDLPTAGLVYSIYPIVAAVVAMVDVNIYPLPTNGTKQRLKKAVQLVELQ